MPRKLSRIRIVEGSVCRQGANQRAKIALFKSADVEPACSCQRNVNQGEEMAPKNTEQNEGGVLASLSESQIAEIKKSLGLDDKKHHDELMAKANTQIEALSKALEAEREVRLQRDAIEKASKMPVAGATVEAVATMLRKVNAVDPKIGEEIEKILSACSKAITESNLMKEAGVQGNGTPSTSISKMETIAKSIKEKNPQMTDAEAMVAAYDANPGLYEAVMAGK